MANRAAIVYDTVRSGNDEVLIPDSSSQDDDLQILARNEDLNGRSIEDRMEEQILEEELDDYFSLRTLASDSDSFGGDTVIWSNSDAGSSESDSHISSSTAELESADGDRPEVICIDDSDSDGDIVCISDFKTELNKEKLNAEVGMNECVAKYKDKVASVPSSTVVSGALSQEEKYFETLLNILPEADHVYLRQEAAKIESTEALHHFINKSVSEENYPRKSNSIDGEGLARFDSKNPAFSQKESQNPVHSVPVSVIRTAPSSSSQIKDFLDFPPLRRVRFHETPTTIVPRHQSVPSTSVGPQPISERNVTSSSSNHFQNRSYDQPAPSTSAESVPTFVENGGNIVQFEDLNFREANPSVLTRPYRLRRSSTQSHTVTNQQPSSSSAAAEFTNVRENAENPRRFTNVRRFFNDNAAAEPTPGTSFQNDVQNDLERLSVELGNQKRILQQFENAMLNRSGDDKAWLPLVHKNESAEPTSTADVGPGLYDRWMNTLTELLPDADPTFLMHETRKLKSYDDLQELILQLVPGDNYPKKQRNRRGGAGVRRRQLDFSEAPAEGGGLRVIEDALVKEWNDVLVMRNRRRIPAHLPPPPAHRPPPPAYPPPTHRPLPPPAHRPPPPLPPFAPGAAPPFAPAAMPPFPPAAVPPFAPAALPPFAAHNNFPHPPYPGLPPFALPPRVHFERHRIYVPIDCLGPGHAANEPPEMAYRGRLFLREPPMLTIPAPRRNPSETALFFEKYQRLLSFIPTAQVDYCNAVCEQFNTLAEIDAHARYAMEHMNYPRNMNAYAQQLVALFRDRRRRRGQTRNMLIEHFVRHHGPQEGENVARNVAPATNGAYRDLFVIFPDADRAYLEKEIADFGSEDDAKKFILRGFAYRDYPRRTAGQQTTPQELRRMSTLECHARLLALLPDADPSYIIQASSTLGSLEEVEAFAAKAAAEKNYPKRRDTRKRRLSNTDESPSDPRFLSLKEMLPDADPEYLERAAKRMRTDEDVESFVLNAVEARNYPKLDAYLKRKEYLDMWSRYIQDFNVEEYLALFPDPIAYFYSEKKGSKNMPAKFLLYRYSIKSVKYLNSVYEEKEYSITKACDRLDYEFSITPKKFYEWDGSTQFDLTVLQEIAFIQNKREIAHYILSKNCQKELAFEKAKENGELVECSCCYDERLSEDTASCPQGHFFCVNCIKRGSEVSIGEGKTSFPCYNSDCGAEFPFELLKKVLRPDVFSRLMSRKQYEEVKAAGIPGLETCPFCEYCSIPDATDKVFRCLNPMCMKITCRKCKKVEHLPLTCDEMVQREETETEMKKYVEEKMTEALVRTCYNCNTKFIKEDGCNLMKCHCGARMCYVCHEAVTGYEHFDRGACQLYTSLKVLHGKNVIAEGKKAKKDMEAANPGIHLADDPTTEPM